MKRIEGIKGLINKELIEKSISNNTDSYGNACVNVAINVMKYLDDFDGEFNIGYSPDMTTPHAIICSCDDKGGISGFMAGFIKNTIAHCHELGWKFYLAGQINPYMLDSYKHINELVEEISSTDLVSYAEAKKYAEDLIERYIVKVKK